MSFSGKYQLESQEGFVEFMKAIGIPDDLIEKGKDVKSVSEIEQNGDHFKVVITTGTKVMTNNFTIGQETEIETLTGEKVKRLIALMMMMMMMMWFVFQAVVNKEGNKLKVVLSKVTSVTELVDENTLVNTLILGSLVYKRISKRVA
ncbi:hypothetical protein M9458_019094 [Cirrhinus mrigala]|uniref:Uncharacterized protein n=1 Tax=Cirrhinus mrigala TaxID=683832 RepID=A0ABD0QMN2_CIRMR